MRPQREAACAPPFAEVKPWAQEARYTNELAVTHLSATIFRLPGRRKLPRCAKAVLPFLWFWVVLPTAFGFVFLFVNNTDHKCKQVTFGCQWLNGCLFLSKKLQSIILCCFIFIFIVWYLRCEIAGFCFIPLMKCKSFLL